jgi:Flp pilus assembly protein TadG
MIGRRLRSGRGQAAVELALILPVLVLILYVVFQFGQVYLQYQEVSAATSEGARQASNMADVAEPGRTSTIIATVKAAAGVKNNAVFDPSALVVAVTTSGTWTPGDAVTVTSKYQANVTILGVTLFSDNLTTRRTARVLD